MSAPRGNGICIEPSVRCARPVGMSWCFAAEEGPGVAWRSTRLYYCSGAVPYYEGTLFTDYRSDAEEIKFFVWFVGRIGHYDYMTLRKGDKPGFGLPSQGEYQITLDRWSRTRNQMEAGQGSRSTSTLTDGVTQTLPWLTACIIPCFVEMLSPMSGKYNKYEDHSKDSSLFLSHQSSILLESVCT